MRGVPPREAMLPAPKRTGRGRACAIREREIRRTRGGREGAVGEGGKARFERESAAVG